MDRRSRRNAAHQAVLRPRGGFPIQPDWSPDGSHIVFALDPTNDQFTHPDNALYTITAQGTDPQPVNGSHDFKNSPEWWQ